MLQVHAAFAVAFLDKGGKWVAATTRVAGGPLCLGLPGGKVDRGEDVLTALLREAREEGWLLETVDREMFYCSRVEGAIVAWYMATIKKDVRPRAKDLERGIYPVIAPWYALRGYGNDTAVALARKAFLGGKKSG